MEKLLITECQLNELMQFILKLKPLENFNINDDVMVNYRKTQYNLNYLVSIEGVNVAWGWCATEMINEYTDTIKIPLNELLKSLHPYSNTIKG